MISSKPKKYCLKAGEVLWLLGNRITAGRLRQIARAHEIGFLESDLHIEGTEDSSFTRWYAKSDILKIIAGSKSLAKAAKSGELDFEEKLKRIA